MVNTKIRLVDLLNNPWALSLEPGISKKIPSLFDLQPIVIYSSPTGNGNGIRLRDSLLDHGITEVYLNPSKIEIPLRSFGINLDKIEIIY